MTTPPPTLVTAVFDLGRSGLAPPFHRDADHYRRHLPAVLSIDLPMVIYTDAAHLDLVTALRGDRPTKIHAVVPDALAQHALYARSTASVPIRAGLRRQTGCRKAPRPACPDTTR